MYKTASVTSSACQDTAATVAICLQVQYSQRNLSANSQRKYLQNTYIPKGYTGDELMPSFPLELKDVQLLSVSPSGTILAAAAAAML